MKIDSKNINSVIRTWKPIFFSHAMGVQEGHPGTVRVNGNTNLIVVIGSMAIPVSEDPMSNIAFEAPGYFTEREEAVAHCRNLLEQMIYRFNTELFGQNPIRISHDLKPADPAQDAKHYDKPW